jgi:hypothetical protein
MTSLVEKAKNTTFGKNHNFSTITTYSDFKKHSPFLLLFALYNLLYLHNSESGLVF